MLFVVGKTATSSLACYQLNVSFLQGSSSDGHTFLLTNFSKPGPVSNAHNDPSPSLKLSFSLPYIHITEIGTPHARKS